MMKVFCFFIAFVAFFLLSKAAPVDNSTNEYYVSESNLTFLQAWTECKIMNRNLINLESEASYNSLVEHLKLGKYLVTNSYWLGGARTTNGAWWWLQTQEFIDFSKWAANEPNAVGKMDYCLVLGRDDGDVDPYEWLAKPCSEYRYFICQ